MPTNYTLNWSDPLKPSINLPGEAIDYTSTSLVLTGRGSNNWGEPAQENFLKLLENFAAPTPPLHPTAGQNWYDTGSNQLKMYSTLNTWVVIWPTAGGGTTWYSNLQGPGIPVVESIESGEGPIITANTYIKDGFNPCGPSNQWSLIVDDAIGVPGDYYLYFTKDFNVVLQSNLYNNFYQYTGPGIALVQNPSVNTFPPAGDPQQMYHKQFNGFDGPGPVNADFYLTYVINPVFMAGPKLSTGWLPSTTKVSGFVNDWYGSFTGSGGGTAQPPVF